ncbi:MAG: FtsX-like permease family protein [Spirochaetales bacterium]|nr:FtsX-like permease family protein [Spirochaetales bacterium]
MAAILRIAFRNLFEHRSKSLIIGILLALGSMILVVGNGFIDASRLGIRNSFIENYTGNVFISGLSEDGDVSLFGVSSVGGLAATPTIPEFEAVLAQVKASPQVESVTSLATGFGIAMRDESSIAATTQTEDESEEEMSSETAMARFLFFFGIDPQNYWDVFDSTEITAGEALKSGQTGLVINESQLAKLSDWMKHDIKVGDSLVVQGFSSGGMKLREIPIVGTYKQKGESTTPEQMAFLDINTLRVMTGMTVGANEDIELEESQTAMLAADDFDALFGDDLFEEAPALGGFDEEALQTELADTTARELANTADTGAWQFIVVRTVNEAAAAPLIASLNKSFTEQGIAAKAGNWLAAAGPYGQSVDVIRIVFTVAIIILSIVAIIIIMNTFVISVIERTGEIGTMRAIGAGRGFIRRLFAAEALVLAGTFSLVGAGLGTIVTMILKALRIEAGNPFLEVLFGGTYLSPFVTPINFISALVAMLLVGYLAHLYPVSVALRIQPVRAMQQE